MGMGEGMIPPEVDEAAEIHNQESAEKSEPQSTEKQEGLSKEQEEAIHDWAHQKASFELMNAAYGDIPIGPTREEIQKEAEKMHEAAEGVNDIDSEVRYAYYDRVIAEETERMYQAAVDERENQRAQEHFLKEKNSNVRGSVTIEEIRDAETNRAHAAKAAWNVKQYGTQRIGLNPEIFDAIDDENDPMKI